MFLVPTFSVVKPTVVVIFINKERQLLLKPAYNVYLRPAFLPAALSSSG